MRIIFGKLDDLDSNTLSVEDFDAYFERKNKPAILRNIMNDWRACERWKIENLVKFYGDYEMDIGSSTFNYQTIKKFIIYANSKGTSKIFNPDYVFEADLGKFGEIADDYNTPKYFDKDFLTYLNRVNPLLRPDWRWMLIGAKRSGFEMHVDPHFTSAWNGLVIGEKRWVLFPPSSSLLIEELLKPYYFKRKEEFAEGEEEIKEKEGEELNCKEKEEGYVYNDSSSLSAMHWFTNIYPILQFHSEALSMIEFVQEEKDVLFIPAGWFHVAISLSITVGITENYLSKYQFEKAFNLYRKEDEEGARSWFMNLPPHEQQYFDYLHVV